jgi:3-oxoacyl-[acyl-carrier-protein] synthase II
VIFKFFVKFSFIYYIEYKSLPCRIAAKIDTDSLFKTLLEKNLIKKSDIKSMSLANIYALIAADEAIKDSKWTARDELDSIRSGTSIATGMAGVHEIADASIYLEKKNFKAISPYFVPKILPNLSSGLISIRHKLKVTAWFLLLLYA